MAVATVGEQNDSVGEIGIELRQGKDDTVGVRSFDYHIVLQTRSAQSLAERHTRPLKQFCDGNTFVHGPDAFLIEDRHGLPVHRPEIIFT